MIPKRLIFCNFGHMNLREEVELRCMRSWEKYFPKTEWEWIELNESTFDINCHPYTKECYEKKLYAFVADYARTYELYHRGGVYVDFDQLMLKSLSDDILNEKFFIGSAITRKYEKLKTQLVSWGLVGSVPKFPLIKDLLEHFDYVDNPETKHATFMLATKRFVRYYAQINRQVLMNTNDIIRLNDVAVYPFDYFTCSTYQHFDVDITDRTYGVQLFAGTWLSQVKKRVSKRILSLKEIEE